MSSYLTSPFLCSFFVPLPSIRSPLSYTLFSDPKGLLQSFFYLSSPSRSTFHSNGERLTHERETILFSILFVFGPWRIGHEMRGRNLHMRGEREEGGESEKQSQDEWVIQETGKGLSVRIRRFFASRSTSKLLSHTGNLTVTKVSQKWEEEWGNLWKVR